METDELVQRLVQAVLTFVSYRPRSRGEITAYLDKRLAKSKRDDASVIRQTVLERIDELGYIDDLKFAVAWVTGRSGRKPKGERLVRQELASKGIDTDTIDTAMRLGRQEVQPEEDANNPENTLALRAAGKKDRVYAKLPLPERRNKLFAYLMRQGFSSDVARRAIDEVIAKNYNRDDGDQ